MRASRSVRSSRCWRARSVRPSGPRRDRRHRGSLVIGGSVRAVIVFVHGVPETAAIWDGVRERIDRESVALSLPGFGNPRPAGFGATKDDYVDWLLGELDGIDEPIDLVGPRLGRRLHAPGGHRPRRPAALVGRRRRQHRPPRLRVAPDRPALADPRRRRGVRRGAERDVGRRSGPPASRGLGVPHDGALEMAAASDADMGSCILDLYRSAVPNPHHDWGPLAPTHAPRPRAPRHRGSLRRRGDGRERWPRRWGPGSRRSTAPGTSGPTRRPTRGRRCSRASGTRWAETRSAHDRRSRVTLRALRLSLAQGGLAVGEEHELGVAPGDLLGHHQCSRGPGRR